jgi:hypothetical protein
MRHYGIHDSCTIKTTTTELNSVRIRKLQHKTATKVAEFCQDKKAATQEEVAQIPVKKEL